ncbi:hypothetical protein CK203_060427 [Vitis vinifera]|uniref:Retrotransposon gag domain-containing protein n=1 Tax=Vitis vinifera TaxID=29760 RepID=A0A438FR99_VITVI|nr:hypothetical protein CK203_060427 [Vitis vinifera]
MTTLHGSAPSLRRCAEGCILLESMIASARDLLKSTHIYLEPPSPRSLQLRVHRDQWEFSTVGQPVFVLDTLLVSVQIIIPFVRVEGRLVRYSERPSMDQQEIGGQQSRPPAVQDETPYDSHPPPPPLPIPSVPQASPYILHGYSKIAPSVVVQTTVVDDAHARMDHLDQRMRQMRVSDGSVFWDDFEGISVASLPAKFRMPDIERYTGIGCSRIHLRLYSTVMRAHAQEFLREFSFNTVVDVSRRELEALRQMTDESISSFISRWRGKIAEIIDRPSERDQIQMVLRSLQPRIARHVVGVPFADFGSLVLTLYDVEDGISRGL